MNKKNTSLSECIVPEFLNNALSEPSKEIGRSIANIFYFTLYPINMPIEKLRLKQAVNLKKYQSELSEKLSQIPEENLIEPKLSIVGPALEASKYYIEEEEIRNMFAQLITASVDDRYSSRVHHSFVEIIKQISPLDAQNLLSFGNMANRPIVNYIVTSDAGEFIIQEHVFLENENCNDLNKISVSITNLQRLGIVSIDYVKNLHPETYTKFKEHKCYLEYQDMYKDHLTVEIPVELKHVAAFLTNQRVEIQKGVISLTPFGSSFKRICL